MTRTQREPLPPDPELVGRLRDGDEALFEAVVERYHSSFIRLAARYVGSRAVAEEVAQESWIAILQGIGRFEGRSSFSTWIHRIAIYTARSRFAKESRTLPFSSFSAEDDGEVVSPERFLPPDHDRWPGHWASPPAGWEDLPDGRIERLELRQRLGAAIEALPALQRTVVQLRDVEGLSSEEVCDLLSISSVNQRVLLHRGRSRMRAALERCVESDEPALAAD